MNNSEQNPQSCQTDVSRSVFKHKIKMKNLANIEVFNIEITEKGTFAHISFQDLENTDNINNGYDNIRVPMNLRPIQLSVRDNVLVDQSVKNYEDAVGS